MRLAGSSGLPTASHSLYRRPGPSLKRLVGEPLGQAGSTPARGPAAPASGGFSRAVHPQVVGAVDRTKAAARVASRRTPGGAARLGVRRGARRGGALGSGHPQLLDAPPTAPPSSPRLHPRAVLVFAPAGGFQEGSAASEPPRHAPRRSAAPGACVAGRSWRAPPADGSVGIRAADQGRHPQAGAVAPAHRPCYDAQSSHAPPPGNPNPGSARRRRHLLRCPLEHPDGE